MNNITLGALGEDIALRFLQRKKFTFVERNYWKKWGEIDLIVKKDGKIHFVEVKSVSREITGDVIHETEGYQAEDNIHERKLKRLQRVIGSYLLERNVEEGDWSFHAVMVAIDSKRKKARVHALWDIIL